MKKNQIIKGALAVLLLAAAVAVFANWFNRGDPDAPKEDPPWLCLNPACKHEFAISAKEQLRLSRQGIACPKCSGKDTSIAYKCPNCSRLCLPVEHGSRPKTCPHCKQIFPRPKPPSD